MGASVIEKLEVLGEVTDGGFAFMDRAHLTKMLKGFKRGTVLCTFKAHRETRSHAQNRYWHGVVVPLFAEHCGYEFEEAKDALALKLLPKEVTDIETGEIRVVPGHTSELNTKDFNDLVERAQRFGSELGVYVPDPGEGVTGKKGRAA